MKTNDFNKKLTSSKLKENFSKMFGMNVKLEQYSREQLEDMRNKIRTRIFQQEGQAGFNDLLTNETYQKDKAMLALLNIRIKEMLGEDIAKLRDKLVQLDEAKKGVRAPKYTKKAKGTNDGDLANNYPPFDKVTRGDVIAGATGKDQKGGKHKGKDQKTAEGVKDMEKAVKAKSEPQSKGGAGRKTGRGYDSETNVRTPPEGKVPFTSFHQGKAGDFDARSTALAAKGKLVKGKAQSAPQPKDKHGVDEAAEKCNHTPKGKKCPVHGLKECGTYEGAMSNLDADRKDRAYQKRQGNFDPLKHINNPTPGEMAAAQDVDRGSYADRAALLRSAKADGRLKEAGKPSAGMSKSEKSAVVKKAKAGGDIGKPGKGFEKVEKAAKKGGAKNPKAVAAAAMWKQQAKKESQEIFRRHVRIVNESLSYLLSEDEEGKAKAITAAGDMVNDYTSWMQRVGQYQTKSMIELADAIRADFGAAEAEAFKQAVAPALSATLETLMSQREAISNAVAVLAGEATPMEPMGTEPGIEPSGPDMMNEPAGDEFAAADAAAGAGTPGREMRESRFQEKLAESHSIISRLAR